MVTTKVRAPARIKTPVMETMIRPHVIGVCLDTNAMPAVKVSRDDLTLAAGDKIKWVRQMPNQQFEQGGPATFVFKAFDPKRSPFENVVVSDDEIECLFSPVESENLHYYRITVESGGVEYDTVDSTVTVPDDKRPVIRN